MNPRSSGPEPGRLGFSLIEVVAAIGIISFALLSILGVMTIALSVHQDASVDSVFSLMTESALQGVRNYNTPANSLSSSASSSYNFNKLTGYTGYLYFDQDGQISADAYWSGANAASLPMVTTSTTSANQSTAVGVNMSGTTLSANQGKSGMPLPAILVSPPSGSYYICKITTLQPTLSTGGSVSPSLYLIRLTFSWPASAPAASQHSRTVMASISNNTN